MTSSSLSRLVRAVSAVTAAVSCLSITAPLQAQSAPSGGADSGKPVTASLLADSEAAEPGTTLTLAVRFKMEPGWHIYWRNPGETGFPTDVQWGGPAGPLPNAETLYPAPITFISPGDLVSFGYEGEALLMTEVSVPANASGQLQFTAKPKWLMCSDRCIPGRDSLTLSIPVGKARAANTELFARYRAQLPKSYPAGSYPSGVTATAKTAGNALEATLTVNPGNSRIVGEERHESQLHRLYFFPLLRDKTSGTVLGTPQVPAPDSSATVAGGQVKVYTKPVTITVKAESGESAKPAPSALTGVLVLQRLGTDGTPQKPEVAELTIR